MNKKAHHRAGDRRGRRHASRSSPSRTAHLTRGGQVKLEAKAEPRDVLIAPDGKTAYALRFGDGKVTKLAIKGDQLSRVADFDVGVQSGWRQHLAMTGAICSSTISAARRPRPRATAPPC